MGRALRSIFAGLVCLLLAGLASCGGFFVSTSGSSGGTTNSGDYIYVANTNNTYLAGFSVSTTGALGVLSGSPYNNGIAAQSLTVNPANTLLYVATTNGIYAYLINTNGSLSIANSGSPVAQDVVATAMQVDSTGAYLLAAGVSTATSTQGIGIYKINISTGALTASGGSPLALYTGTGTTPSVVAPSSMLITPDNSYVYVSLGALGVQVLALSSEGGLSTGTKATTLPPLSTSTSPSAYGLASNSASTFLFVTEINTGLRVFSIGTGGVLNELSGSPYAVGTGPAAVTLDPTEAYVYVANKGDNTISGFTLTAASGQLTAISSSPFSSVGQLPLAMITDRSKSFLAVINSGSNGASGQNDLQVFKYDATVLGQLDAVSSATTGTDPTNPGSIAATH